MRRKRPASGSERRAELVRLMLEIAALDRNEYRRLLAEMYASIRGQRGDA